MSGYEWLYGDIRLEKDNTPFALKIMATIDRLVQESKKLRSRYAKERFMITVMVTKDILTETKSKYRTVLAEVIPL
jgi:hypothetical protein